MNKIRWQQANILFHLGLNSLTLPALTVFSLGIIMYDLSCRNPFNRRDITDKGWELKGFNFPSFKQDKWGIKIP